MTAARAAAACCVVALLLPGARPLAQDAVQSLHVQGNVWMIHSPVANAAVQIGDEGVLIVDTLTAPLADALLAEVRRLAGNKPIRAIINTSWRPNHAGGNARVAVAGRTIIGGNAVAELGQAAADRAQVYAHENVQLRMRQRPAGEPEIPFDMWPSDTYIEGQKDLYFNGEGIELLHQPAAATDGDTVVYFRKSDVVVTGEAYINTTFPNLSVAEGGTLNGIVKALNVVLRITIPKEKQEGGTYVIPGQGRLVDEADVVEYRDMMTIIRDRIADAIRRGQTLEQVKAARLLRDYEGRYGPAAGGTTAFIEAAYRSLTPVAATATRSK